MRRKFSTTFALIGIALGLMIGSFAPHASAQVSILPTDGDSLRTTEDNKPLNNCEDIRRAIEANPKGVEGRALALKIRCGRMMLGDLPFYFQHALGFVLNTIGTLAIIAVIRAGYIFMLSKDKEYADGRKAVLQVIIGLVIAALSFTAAQIVLRVLFAVSNASPV